jgi:hypothetical protein
MATTKPKKNDENAVLIRDAVVAHYLETGGDIDAQGLAARLGWSATKVRKVINDNHGSVPGVHPYEDQRHSYSRNFPDMAIGSHKVWVYRPQLSYLRELLLAARGAAESK